MEDAAVDVALPLTGAQAGIWLAQQLAPGSPVFNTADAVELSGPLDESVVVASIRAVLDDAEALHARFLETADGPVQVLQGTRDWELPVVDLRGAPDPAQDAEAWMTDDLARAVDLSTGPLFTAALLRTSETAWTWYLRIHHIATDAYATALLMRRVAERVTAGGAEPHPAPKPFGTVAELLAAEASYRESDAYLADRAFWAGRLAGHAAPATLAGQTAPAAPRPVRAQTILSAEVGAAVAAAGLAAGAGWPELVMAAFAANLASVTGARRQVLSMPVLARKGAARRTPGACVNVVPLAVEVDPAAPLADLVGAIRDELRALRPHHGLRFEELQRMLPLGTPLFGPQVNLKPYVRELPFGPGVARIRNLATGPVDDLSLIVTDLPGGALELTLDGNAALYDAHAVHAQLARVVTTLSACAAAGATARPVGSLPTLPADERAQVLQRFNATAHPVDDRATLVSLLRAQLAATPDAPAVSDDRETVSYRELHRRAEALAGALRERGAGPDAIVGLGLRRCVGLSVGVVGVLLAGAAYLPLDPDLPADRLAYVAGDARPVAVVATAEAAGALPGDLGAGAILIDAGGEVIAGGDARTAGGSAADAEPLPPETSQVPAPGDAAYVLYTSGSTGRPKGVVTEHRAIVNRLAWMQDALPIGLGDVVLQKTPYGFDVSVWELLWPLLRGARLVMAEPGGHRDPQYLAEVIQREAVTTLHFVPSMLDLFLEDRAVPTRCASLRQVVCSGEALPESTVRRYHELLSAPLHNLYGPTEAAIDVTWWPCRPEDAPGPVPIGAPIWNTRTYVLDEAQRPVPVGSPGELWLAGRQLAREYLGRPDLTAERFMPDPFAAEWAAAGAPLEPGARMYRTGDLACWRPDGALVYLGRTDDQVKLRGLRIELGEIEETLGRHPAVVRAAASVDRAGGPARLVAHVVLADRSGPVDATSDATGATAGDLTGALLAHTAATLPDYMVPAALAYVEELPLSPNGKLDRRRLPAVPRDGAEGGATTDTGRPPATPREQQLCELFAEALDRGAVGPDQHLFELGGDSLRAARLAARIRTRLGIDLQLGAIFAAPTPAALAARIDEGGDLRALEPMLDLRSSGDAPPLFCLHPAGGIGWCYGGLARTIDDRPIVAVQAPTLSGGDLAATLEEQAARYADRIEEHAPGGPIHLLGWSVGGVLAHATAGALQDRGRETGIVALLDAYPGEQWAGQAPPTPEETLLALLHMGGLGEPALGGESPTLDRVLAALSQEGSALASLGTDTFAAVAHTVRESSRLMREHRTRRIAGDLLFFEATAPRREDWLDAGAWAGHVSGGVDRHAVPVTHPEMPRRGPIDEIAAVVAAALASYDSSSASPSRSSTAGAAPASTASVPT